MDGSNLKEPAEANEFLCDLIVDQPNSDTSPLEQSLARLDSLFTPFDGQNLAIKQIPANVVVLHKTVELIEVTGREFGVSQPLRFHVYNSARL